MKLFAMGKVREAIQFSMNGGQAVHVWDGSMWPGRAPVCFRRHREWAHLLDQDEARLVATAKRLGVRRVVVSRRGQREQHVDLCGAPLERAKRQTKEPDLFHQEGGEGG